MKNIRQSNFELLRIISMFFIILWHIMMHGKIFENLGEPYTFIANIFLAIIMIHVNSLVFVTGYFMGDKKEIKVSKALRLLGMSWFYHIVILGVLLFTHSLMFTKIEILDELSPLNIRGYWFLGSYITLYLLIPYLNRVIVKMDQKSYTKFLLVLILLLSIIPTISNGRFIENTGYNVANFIVIYFLGAYFKRFPIRENPMLKELSSRKWRWILIGCFFLTVAIRIGFYYLGEKIQFVNSEVLAYWGSIITGRFLCYATPLVILQTCIYCLFFESISIKSKMINYIAGTTFGIYLIHDNINLRVILYPLLETTRYGASKRAIIWLFVIAFILFVSCFIIESIRKLFVMIIQKGYLKIKKKKSTMKS